MGTGLKGTGLKWISPSCVGREDRIKHELHTAEVFRAEGLDESRELQGKRDKGRNKDWRAHEKPCLLLEPVLGRTTRGRAMPDAILVLLALGRVVGRRMRSGTRRSPLKALVLHLNENPMDPWMDASPWKLRFDGVPLGWDAITKRIGREMQVQPPSIFCQMYLSILTSSSSHPVPQTESSLPSLQRQLLVPYQYRLPRE